MSAARKSLGLTGQRSATWRGGPVELNCAECGAQFAVTRDRAETARYCSNDCRAAARGRAQQGEANPRWQGGVRTKVCAACGTEFHRGATGLKQWTDAKFCSKKCADQEGGRLRGPENPTFKPDARRRSRSGAHSSWADRVLSRDGATCQECGARDVPMHAHHVKAFEKFPDLRFDVTNGITLCFACHWRKHSAEGDQDSAAPAVGWKGDKPTRRWEGNCDWCGEFISRAWGHAKKSDLHFCTTSCRGKHWAATRAPQTPEVVARRIALSAAVRRAKRAAPEGGENG